MTPTLILFFILALVAVVSALGMLFSKNAVVAALFLILNFLTVAILYLILDAPFIAIAQVTVYAGAIMVLFLFVIMLLGAEQTGRTPERWWIQPVSLLLGVAFLVELIVVMISFFKTTTVAANLPPAFGSPVMVGETLFIKFVLPFEATSILLLIAMIGAIVLTRPEKK